MLFRSTAVGSLRNFGNIHDEIAQITMSLPVMLCLPVLRQGGYRMRSQLLVLLCVLGLVCGCGGSVEPPAGSDVGTATAAQTTGTALSARLALNWYPEVEHGGFIAADVLGKFSAEGVAVEIIPGGPGAPQAVIAELAAGRIQFAVSDADNVVLARAAGVPIVEIGRAHV